MPLLLIYAVTIIEGFSTLAVQLIAMRTAAPIVGSSIILTSVYIGVILLALSAGYYIGGIISSKFPKEKLMRILAGYLVFAGLRYLFITFWREKELLEFLLTTLNSYIWTLFISAVILFAFPVFIASQTLPLLTEIIPEESKGKAAGKILFSSTIGSFLGSVITTIVLFESLGVSVTGALVGSSLFGAAGLVLLTRHHKLARACFVSMFLVFWLSTQTFDRQDASIVYSFDSSYQSIEIREMLVQGRPSLIYHTNGAFSSAVFKDDMTSPFKYIREMVDLTQQLQPRNILVIGAAGFVYPEEVALLPYVQRIDTVDIDPQVKRVAEEEFLNKDLHDKITFYPESARYFVNQQVAKGVTYDLVVVDAYVGKTVPDELTTVEFFAGLKQLANNDRVTFNVIMDTEAETDFANNLMTTMMSVYGDVYAKNVSQNTQQVISNFVVGFESYTPEYKLQSPQGVVYTDDKRSTETDVVDMFWEL